jgi:hypothetical protein
MRVRLLHSNGASLFTWARSKTMFRRIHVIIACFVRLHTLHTAPVASYVADINITYVADINITYVADINITYDVSRG